MQEKHKNYASQSVMYFVYWLLCLSVERGISFIVSRGEGIFGGGGDGGGGGDR